MDGYIQLKKDSILRIGIKDANGNPTGEHLEFDLEDIELPIRLNQSKYEHEKNVRDLETRFLIIDKKPDVKGNQIYSKNEKEKLNALREFYQREEKSLDLFIGNGGTKKLLNGRNYFYGMYDEFSEALEPVMKKLELRTDEIKNKIVTKYSVKKEDNILE